MVYIDSLRDRGWKYGPNCHMVADTLQELNEFASIIGMRIGWLQMETTRPHYDLTARRREWAVKLGAVEVSSKEIVRIARECR